MRIKCSPIAILTSVFALASGSSLLAQCTQPCPANATDTAVAVGLSAFRINPDGSTGGTIGGATVGQCQKIRLRMSLSYTPNGPGGPAAAFAGGRMVIRTSDGVFSQDVTPAGGVPTIAPATEIVPGGCAAGGTNFFLSTFTTDFDINAYLGSVPCPPTNGGVRRIAFQALYGPQGTIAFLCPPITNQTAGTTPGQVNVALPPCCSIAPGSVTVCAGGSASYTVTGTNGVGPYTFSWTGPNGFTATGPTITINNAQAANAGTYTATLTDFTGCQSTCTAVLIVVPNPIVGVNSPSICSNFGPTTLTATVSNAAAVGPVTYLWSPGGQTSQSISVNPAVTTTYCVTVTSANNCTGTNCGTVTVNPNPFCNISGTNELCGGAIATYTSSGTPGVANAWTISGSGTIIGATNGTSVTVQAGLSGTFTLTDHVTTSAGCVGQCSLPVTIIPCLVQICVTKQVACYLPPGCGTFGHTATGVSANGENPAFCYMITVTNCGTVGLTNVSVIDVIDSMAPTNLTAEFPCVADVMLPGTGCTFTYTAEVPLGPGGTINVETNTVTATGFSVTTGQRTNASANAVSIVIPASVTCNKQVSVDGGALENVAQISDQNPHTLVWYVTVNNTGSANLENVQVTDVTANLGCAIALPPFRLDAGASTTFAICTNAAFICTNGLVNTVEVSANEFTYGTNRVPLCNVTIIGTSNATITASSECSATILCSMPTACRVTGGGRQDVPEVCPTTDGVLYVTHGGQVGAPVGNKVCSIDTTLPDYWLGNPCIHGRWTHVRHSHGGTEGNFHARFFDTLDCACLDTNLSPACQYGQGTVVNGICNPGNRCYGPEPRKAPANKIVFTGVGDWTCEAGRRAPRSCLFRVDIEDRGEPGNYHALDRNGKACRIPDRYRIRIWVLTDAELAQLNSGGGADPYLIHFRDCISACNGIDYQDGVCGPNNCSGSTCDGSGTTGTITFPGGCPVRTPNVDDGGALEHGNHQIHPTIMSCDPRNPKGPGLAKP